MEIWGKKQMSEEEDQDCAKIGRENRRSFPYISKDQQEITGQKKKTTIPGERDQQERLGENHLRKRGRREGGKKKAVKRGGIRQNHRYGRSEKKIWEGRGGPLHRIRGGGSTR